MEDNLRRKGLSKRISEEAMIDEMITMLNTCAPDNYYILGQMKGFLEKNGIWGNKAMIAMILAYLKNAGRDINKFFEPREKTPPSEEIIAEDRDDSEEKYFP